MRKVTYLDSIYYNILYPILFDMSNLSGILSIETDLTFIRT